MSIAVLFAKNGAKILLADIDEEAALRTQKKIIDQGGEATAFVTDVATEEGCKNTIEATVKNYGSIDIVVNSVGISGRGMVTEITEKIWDRVLDVNLKSMAFISKYAVSVMENNGGGSIINISSVDGIRAGFSKNIPYAAAKGGIISATRAMAVHHGRQNIRVNCIAPGLLHATMTENYTEEHRKIRKDIAPLGIEGTSDDIANAALFLASEESRWITGVLLPVDAGLMAAGPQSILNNVIDDWNWL